MVFTLMECSGPYLEIKLALLHLCLQNIYQNGYKVISLEFYYAERYLWSSTVDDDCPNFLI